MLDLHTSEHGCVEILTPYLVTRETMEGTGQLPKFEDDAFKSAEDELFLIAADAGAEDLETEGGQIQIICPFEDFDLVRLAIQESQASIALAEITMVPQTTVTLDEKQAEQMIRLMDLLDDNDDVQKVYANFDIPDDILEAAQLGNRLLVLGVDSGLANTGYGFVRAVNSKFEMVDKGNIQTTAKIPSPERLKVISDALDGLVEQYQPQALAIEELFFSKNVTLSLIHI